VTTGEEPILAASRISVREGEREVLRDVTIAVESGSMWESSDRSAQAECPAGGPGTTPSPNRGSMTLEGQPAQRVPPNLFLRRVGSCLRAHA